MRYIDAEKLIAEIEGLNSLVPYENNDRHDDGLHDAYKAVKNVIDSLQQEQPEIFDSVAFQKGVQEGRRLEREDVKSTIQSRIDEILGDVQPNPVLRMELQELIKKIEA